MTDRHATKRFLKIWLAVLAGVVVIGYAGFQAKTLFLGPKVEITAPLPGATVSESVIDVSGTAKNISFLSLNGNKIYTDEAGNWRDRLLLSYGYNVITVEAEDRFGRHVIQSVEVIYK